MKMRKRGYESSIDIGRTARKRLYEEVKGLKDHG